jgi:predicted nucleic acid-binding protein
MKDRVLDTCILIDIWHGRSPSRVRVRSEETARSAAQAWLKKYPRDAILTPIRLEFYGGTRDKDDLRLAGLFLDEFDLLDEGKVLVEDWRAAERYARWVRGEGRARGALDSLIRAICDRVGAELNTHDTGI